MEWDGNTAALEAHGPGPWTGVGWPSRSMTSRASVGGRSIHKVSSRHPKVRARASIQSWNRRKTARRESDRRMTHAPPAVQVAPTVGVSIELWRGEVDAAGGRLVYRDRAGKKSAGPGEQWITRAPSAAGPVASMTIRVCPFRCRGEPRSSRNPPTAVRRRRRRTDTTRACAVAPTPAFDRLLPRHQRGGQKGDASVMEGLAPRRSTGRLIWR